MANDATAPVGHESQVLDRWSARRIQPVVVLYVLDALRGDHVGHLGSTLGATPCIDRLAAHQCVDLR